MAVATLHRRPQKPEADAALQIVALVAVQHQVQRVQTRSLPHGDTRRPSLAGEFASALSWSRWTKREKKKKEGDALALAVKLVLLLSSTGTDRMPATPRPQSGNCGCEGEKKKTKKNHPSRATVKSNYHEGVQASEAQGRGYEQARGTHHRQYCRRGPVRKAAAFLNFFASLPHIGVHL